MIEARSTQEAYRFTMAPGEPAHTAREVGGTVRFCTVCIS